MSNAKTNTKAAKRTKTAKENAKTAKETKAAKEKPAALETSAIGDAPMLGASEPTLGTLSGDADKQIDAPVAAVLRAEPEADTEPLKLPRGGFIAFRKSGGLNFSTREVVVYPDGRVAYDARGVPQKEYTRLRRALNDGQIIALRKLLDQINFWKAESGGQQNPDAFAYEITARIGQRSNEIEVFDGSVPENLKPLLERLAKLLPE